MDKKTLEKWSDVLCYWCDCVEEYGERYPDSARMVEKYNKIIDDLYNLSKTEETNHETKYVLVDKITHEIYVNEFGGDLPPMTIKQIEHYFRCPIESALEKADVKLYPAHESNLCPYCKTELCTSEIQGYKWQCFYCNEDFCEFETIKQ